MEKDSDTANNGGTDRQVRKQPSRLTTGYLILYNLTSNTLWATLTLHLAGSLITILRGLPEEGTGAVSDIFDELFPLLCTAQSVALLEVVHALLGLVRASVVTTTMQVASRVVVVWGVMYMFSVQAMGNNGILGRGDSQVSSSSAAGAEQGSPGDWAFVGCLAAWGITECIRYGFFVLQLSGKGVPKWMLWLRYVHCICAELSPFLLCVGPNVILHFARYNTFFILYPLGISCECTLWYLAMKPAALVHEALPWIFKVILAVYVPGKPFYAL